MQLKLCEENLDANTVVASGDVTYSRPVIQELSCTCSLPGDWNQFLRKLHQKGKGSVLMVSTISTEEGIAMQFNGTYVVRVQGKQ